MRVWRAVAIGLLLAAFLIVGIPLQLLIRQFGPNADDWVPTLLCRMLLGLLQVRVVSPGGERAAARGRLLVANHVSWIDVLALRSIEPLCFTAKQEVGSWPGVATFARLQRTIFIDRRRKRQIPRANRAMAAQLGQGRSVLLFPEGTTYDGVRRGRFLTSHLGSLAEVLRDAPDRREVGLQAAGIAYSDPAAAWIGDATLLPHLWSILGRPPIRCTVTYGAVLSVEGGQDRKALGRTLAESVEALLASAACADLAEVRLADTRVGRQAAG